jgi:hypothetical protein
MYDLGLVQAPWVLGVRDWGVEREGEDVGGGDDRDGETMETIRTMRRFLASLSPPSSLSSCLPCFPHLPCLSSLLTPDSWLLTPDSLRKLLTQRHRIINRNFLLMD